MGITFELDEGVGAQGEGLELGAPEAFGDDDASPSLSRRDQLREIAYCTPGVGRQWARYFATRYAKTSDEHGRSASAQGGVALLPAYRYILDKCEAFELGVDNHGEKTRQMTITWTTAANHLGRTMMATNAAGFVTSRKEKVVDDGGSRSTTFSIVGKMRFIYNHLPDWMRALRPVEFSHLRVDCPMTGSYVIGEGATGEGGRSGTFGRATVDEAAFMPGEGWFRALRAACPEGLGMDSTPNGKANIFWRIKHETPGDFRMLRYHWTRHPVLSRGLYFDDRGKPRSPWYDSKTKSLTLDEIAREYDISYEHSVSGLIWPEFDVDKHCKWEILYDPTLPLYGGMDFGMGAATTVVFFQVHGREMWIVGDYEVWNADVEEHAPAIAKRIEEITGGRLERHEVRIFGDPAGRAREMTNKNSTVIRAYQAHGFKQLVAAPERTKKDRVRLVRRKMHRNEFYVFEGCLSVKKRVPDYRYRTDDMGYVLADVIQENSATHLCDAIQYGATGVFEMDEDGVTRIPKIPKRDEPIPFRPEAMRPIVPVRSPFQPMMSGRKDF